jgi:hypothetical protein
MTAPLLCRSRVSRHRAQSSPRRQSRHVFVPQPEVQIHGGGCDLRLDPDYGLQRAGAGMVGASMNGVVARHITA